MIVGKLGQNTAHESLLSHPIWIEAFQWIERFAVNCSPGIYELRSKKMYVNVHGYDTRARSDCRYESHRIYIDLQYCIAGGEIIEWHALENLVPKDEYDPAKDVIHYHSPAEPSTAVQMVPGNFAIFFNGDGHMPKIRDGRSSDVRKLVIKIDRTLLHEN